MKQPLTFNLTMRADKLYMQSNTVVAVGMSLSFLLNTDMACLVAPEVQIFLYAEIADEQLASSMELLMDGFADTCRSIYGALFADILFQSLFGQDERDIFKLRENEN
uniref:Uncharacterized protein n=1 Tax=Oryza sativa subsp. japonica TaxID=39947 RepID=Q6Z3T5_ORYSJ|nr:hypothetical protein [Oryza sativa Japonica Group]BAD10168.1 hypothetical protein [Oryza sativa Japonica Group]